jgi:hypothetical protein
MREVIFFPEQAKYERKDECNDKIMISKKSNLIKMKEATAVRKRRVQRSMTCLDLCLNRNRFYSCRDFDSFFVNCNKSSQTRSQNQQCTQTWLHNTGERLNDIEEVRKRNFIKVWREIETAGIYKLDVNKE